MSRIAPFIEKRLYDESGVLYFASKLMQHPDCAPELKAAVWANLNDHQRDRIKTAIADSKAYFADLENLGKVE